MPGRLKGNWGLRVFTVAGMEVGILDHALELINELPSRHMERCWIFARRVQAQCS